MGTRGGSLPRGTYRFVHASDLHLDAPVRGLGQVPSPLRAMLRDASLQAWSALVDLARERDAAFVVIAGGLFDADTPTLRSCAALRDGLRRLRADAIDAFIAMTPHDVAAPPRSLPTDAATFFDTEQVSTAYVMRDGECLAALHGTGCSAGDAWERLSAIRASGLGVGIGVWPSALPDDWRGSVPARLTETLRKIGLNYWALGGSIQHAVLHADPLMMLPGTPQGRGLGAADLGPKGCVVVEVDDGRVGGATFEALDPVRFLSIEVDVSGCADAAAIRRRLARELERSIGDASHRAWIVEAVLCGRMASVVAPDRFAFAAELLAALNRDGAAATTPVWWDRVHDRTAGHDRHTDGGARDLRRIVSDQSEALGAPLPRSTFLAETFAPLLRRGDAESDLAAQKELVRDAAALALEMLGSGGSR
jgi:hypothetical protein